MSLFSSLFLTSSSCNEVSVAWPYSLTLDASPRIFLYCRGQAAFFFQTIKTSTDHLHTQPGVAL